MDPDYLFTGAFSAAIKNPKYLISTYIQAAAAIISSMVTSAGRKDIGFPDLVKKPFVSFNAIPLITSGNVNPE